MDRYNAVKRNAEKRIKGRKKYRDANLKQIDCLKTGVGFDWTKVEVPTRLAERARRLGLIEASSALLGEDVDIEAGNRVYEQIIDANNLLGVTFLIEGARKAEAVGRITLPVPGGTRLGTGFMVSSRVMMTNNHVLGDRFEAADATLEFDFYEREDGTLGPVARYRLQPDQLYMTDAPLDFTVVAVEAVNADGDSVGDRGWFPLAGPSGKAVVGERVSIIQHADGKPQQVAVHDNMVVEIDDDDDFLHYETDTMGGSSGSPVLNIEWDLAALHHAAVGNTNEGIRISSIVARLREILSEEAVRGAEAELVAELLAGKAPDARPVRSTGGQPPIEGGGPRLNADGTVSWIVPVSLTVGVGSAVDPSVVPRLDVSTTPAQLPFKSNDQDLQEALRALEAAERKVYYSKKSDAVAREDYYPDLAGLTKDQCYRKLSSLVSDTHTTVLSYKKARLEHLYPWVDRRSGKSRTLNGIYSNREFDALEVIVQEMEMERRRETAIRERMMMESFSEIDEEFLEQLEAQSPFNCEHVVPQSWFNKRKTPRTDLHHLFTCEWGCNSFRGNRAYFEFEEEAFRENCGNSELGKFEPKRGKGAVARATLYFLLRYPDEIADSGKEMPKDRLKTVIKWANDDKVDLWERHRNAEIQKIQGNRNPLIDFPELVDKINFALGWA